MHESGICVRRTARIHSGAMDYQTPHGEESSSIQPIRKRYVQYPVTV